MSLISDYSDPVSLPPGWDAKYDFKTGKRYYINYFTKHTSIDDPRIRYRRLQVGEPLSIQSFQSSPVRSSISSQPFYHMHQDINLSSGRPSPIIGRSCSPLMGSSAIHYHAHKFHEYPTLETSVAKIKSLFPTVSETHVKALLHKYHYREAVVMSALQVEKHPITTPGPYSSPLAMAKHLVSQITPSAPGSPTKFLMSTMRNLSPKLSRSSPKMKLRYLKNVFPVVEETVLLDTLSSSENNVHKASETLLKMGFRKKDLLSPRHSSSKASDSADGDHRYDSNKNSLSVFIPLRDPESKNKTLEEKEQVKKKLIEKFEKVSEHIIAIALESANYNEDRAEHLLTTSITEDKKISGTDDAIPDTKEISKNDKATDTDNLPVNSIQVLPEDAPATKNPLNITEEKSDHREQKRFFRFPSIISTSSDLIRKFNSQFKISSFSNEDKSGQRRLISRIIPKGPDKSLLSARCTPKGPDAGCRRGQCKGLAKGSIYANRQYKNNSAT